MVKLGRYELFKMLSVNIHDHFLPCVETAFGKILKLQKVPPYSSTDMSEEQLSSLLLSETKKQTQS